MNFLTNIVLVSVALVANASKLDNMISVLTNDMLVPEHRMVETPRVKQVDLS